MVLIKTENIQTHTKVHYFRGKTASKGFCACILGSARPACPLPSTMPKSGFSSLPAHLIHQKPWHNKYNPSPSRKKLQWGNDSPSLPVGSLPGRTAALCSYLSTADTLATVGTGS
jgi:hypothetical protein